MKKILVIRVGRAGDVVMITPALRAILEQFPDHELHVLTSHDGKRVLSGFNSRVTNIIIYKKKRLTNVFARFRQLKNITQTDYKYIFNFELKPAYKRIYKDIDAKIYELDKIDHNLNYAKRCLNIVERSIDREIQNYWDWLPVTEEGVKNSKKQLLDAGINEEDIVIGIHPSFSGSKKGLAIKKSRNLLREWPPEYFATVIKMLVDYGLENDLPIKVVIDLLPDEKALGDRILKLCDNKAALFTLKPDFQRYKALIKRMNFLITPDTGPMHIAAAVGTNIICLFSGKSPQDCGPYMNSADYIALVAENYNDIEGLQAIKPEHVFTACKKFLPG
jgi:ADP-heptose:LPS heptosyltransferase